jgi:O-antigen/teichoic acid export membrane protein
MKDLKHKTIRGGFAKICGQGANFCIRLGCLMILARLLDPRDFGIVGMVTALTGVLRLFKDFGLSTAVVQRPVVTNDQQSTLFWVNILVGGLLALASVAGAPFIAGFYHEPRLFWVTVVLGAAFLFNAAGVQHMAVLQREMQFTIITTIGTASLFLSSLVGVVMALHGYRYWALVGIAILNPLISSMCVWLTTGWVPGLPRKKTGTRSMLRFGGTVTLNGIVAYVAFNLEKVLLGRFWGADAIGVYGRAFSLINIPTDSLSSAAGEVGFSALSRIQNDGKRFRSCFIKGYSLILALTIPMTVTCALFAKDVIRVILGTKWAEAVPILRLLSPTIFVLSLIYPLGWVLYSLGLVGRSLKIALVFAPLMITGYVLGLPHGPKGVAFAYSAVMIVWVIPHIIWSIHGTVIRFRDIVVAVSRPLASSIVAGGLAFGVRLLWARLMTPLPRLVLESAVLFGAYMLILLFATGQKSFYLDLLHGLRIPSPAKGGAL